MAGGCCPRWSAGQDLNLQSAAYKAAALPLSHRRMQPRIMGQQLARVNHIQYCAIGFAKRTVLPIAGEYFVQIHMRYIVMV